MFEPGREKESKVSPTVFSYFGPEREKTLKIAQPFFIFDHERKKRKSSLKNCDQLEFPSKNPKL